MKERIFTTKEQGRVLVETGLPISTASEKNFLQKHSDAYVLYGMLVLTHLTHTIKKQTLIRNSRQSRILLLKNLG